MDIKLIEFFLNENNQLGQKITLDDRHNILKTKLNLEREEFRYFHPFFILLIHKDKLLILDSIFRNKNFSTCLFTINKLKKKDDLFPIMLAICDEFCGLIISVINEETIYFTTELKITNENLMSIQNDVIPKKYLIETYVVEVSKNLSKIKLNFKIFDENVETVLEGNAMFNKPYKPMLRVKF